MAAKKHPRMRRATQKLSPQALGHSFELVVREIYAGNWYKPVDINQWHQRKSGKREFDLVLVHNMTMAHLYVECKYHDTSQGSPNKTGLPEVKEFHDKIMSHGKSFYARDIVTNTDFTRDAIHFAEDHGIGYKNGDALQAMKEKPSFYLNGIIRAVQGYDRQGLLSTAERLWLLRGSIDDMIQRAHVYVQNNKKR